MRARKSLYSSDHPSLETRKSVGATLRNANAAGGKIQRCQTVTVFIIHLSPWIIMLHIWNFSHLQPFAGRWLHPHGGTIRSGLEVAAKIFSLYIACTSRHAVVNNILRKNDTYFLLNVPIVIHCRRETLLECVQEKMFGIKTSQFFNS